MSSVLVETSVWIEFLKGRSGTAVAALETLIAEGNACVCETVFAEICFGARDEGQLRKYMDRFGAFPFLSLPEAWHAGTARMGFMLRKAGHRPFLADLLIAGVAIHHGVPLLTLDKDFQPYRKAFGLQLLF